MTRVNAMLNVRHPRSNVAVIDIQGEVTARTEDLLANAFAAASSGGIKTIVLNFGGLEYMNSSGIGLLVTLLIRAQRNKQKLLAYGLSDHYQQIFQLTRLDEAIEIYEDEAGALAAAG